MRKTIVVALALLATGCGKPNSGGAAPDSVKDARPEPAESAAAGPQNLAMGPPEVASQTQTSGTSRNLVRFVPGVIVDAAGFGEPTAAASLFVPFGWRMEGGVVWGQEHLCTNGYNFDWRATAPDGSSGIRILPQTRWENNSYGAAPTTPGCSSAPFRSAREYIEAAAPNIFPGGRVIDFRERPDIVKQLGGAQTRTPMPMGEIRTWTEAGEVLVEFNANGRDMRGSLAAAVQFQHSITDMSGMMANDPSAAFGVPQTGPSRMENLSAFAHPAWAVFAPNGAFNSGFFEGIRRSIETNPRWAKAIANHNMKIGQVALQESRKRAQMATETRDYVSRLQQETWNARQASAEKQVREFGEMMKGVETYRDADAPGGQVELDYRYDHAWRLNDGSYVISDDPNFDPWRELHLEGRKLEAVQ